MTLAEELAVRQAVEDTVIRMFVATDERDWPVLEACFTDPFTLDMTSMTGGVPVAMTPRQVGEAWAEGFKPLDHVHHQVGNLQTEVNGQTAVVRCYGVAFHHRSKIASSARTRMFVGTYELQLKVVAARWQISVLTFKLKFIDGNLELEKSA